MGPIDDCLLASLRLDPFCDTTSTLSTPNLIGKMDLCMILGPKVDVLPSFVAKIVGNDYGTDTSVQPATVEVREWSIRVCSFREPE